MKIFKTIESWASNLGYVVEKKEYNYEWFKENEFRTNTAKTTQEVIDGIIFEIVSSYKGEK